MGESSWLVKGFEWAGDPTELGKPSRTSGLFFALADWILQWDQRAQLPNTIATLRHQRQHARLASRSPPEQFKSRPIREKVADAIAQNARVLHP